MRTIRTMLVVTHRTSRTIKTNFMYVRGHLPLPVVGEPIIAIEEESGIEFPGEVIEVDQVRHGYTAKITVPQENGDSSRKEGNE